MLIIQYMTGGILQLVATGKEDEIISVNPHITMFKTMYRRHVNFDKAESILTFCNNLTFGTSATCKIKKLADLVSALTLVIDLPDIDISYLPLTNKQLASILAEYDITWIYSSENADVLITQEEFETVVGKIEYISGELTRLTDGMINDKVDDLTKTINKDNEFTDVINNVTNTYINNHDNNLTNYLDDLMLALLLANRNLFINDIDYINNYDYYNQYYYLYCYKRDLDNLIPQAVSWQDGTGSMRHVISFYDPSIGLPSQIVEDRYICTYSDRGWTKNNIYRWYIDPLLGIGNWVETQAVLGYGVHLQYGFNDMSQDVAENCIGFNKFSQGFYNPNIDGLPKDPTIGDRYISAENYVPTNEWKTNNIYVWNGTRWDETIPMNGNALYVLGSGNGYPAYFRRMIYFNGSSWVIYSPEMTIMYDGTFWRKSVVGFYDPTNGLPTTTVPASIGNIYISTATQNGWKEKYVYIWDGWEWLEINPPENLSTYIEDGTLHSNSIVTYNGYQWNVLRLHVPLFNFTSFRKFTYDALRNIIFTDSNIELLYAVENCNTTVIPTTATLTIREFFDNAVTNEIGTIDTNSAVYKSVYNTYFDTSLTGTLEHVISVQNGLKTAIRSEINNVINPNIQMMTTLYNRLQFVDATNPDYYRYIYYKYYPYTTSYSTSNAIVNCPREYYNTTSSLRDYFASYLINVTYSPETSYMTLIKNAVYSLVGNKSSSTTGALYDTLLESRLTSMFNNFFINTTSNYESVLDSIRMDPAGTSGNRKMYNLPSCINVLSSYSGGQSIKTNITLDYINFSTALIYTLGTKGSTWNGLLTNVINYINTNIPDIEQVIFPSNIWNATDGLLSKMNSSSSSTDRLVSMIFRYYVPYDVHKILPVEYSFVPDFVISGKNPIEYLVLTFSENLYRYVEYQNSLLSSQDQLTNNELNSILLKISFIGNAYLDVGLLDYSSFNIHQTNILASNVPELFIPEVPVFETYHLPYDGITSMTCYILNVMKGEFNLFYQTETEQSIYDAMGNPFMNANDQFVTESDFYIYGNQMYNSGYEIINSMIDVYLNDMTRYDKYGNLLKIKNIYLEKQHYTYDYPLEMYIEFHKAFFNNQTIYINKTLSSYNDTYTNILTLLDNKMLPLLQYLNSTNLIYAGPMDMLMTSLSTRNSASLVNPYDPIIDTTRYNWYNDKIITNVVNVETDFDPSPIGIIEYFLNTINASTNPFPITSYLYGWYNNIERQYVNYEIIKMKQLFGLPYYSSNTVTADSITPESLYNDIGNINSKYNSFASITDFIKYLMDHIINLSQLGDIVPLFKATITSTSDVLLNYYATEKSNSIDMIDKIHPYTLTSVKGSIKYSTLEDIVRNVYDKKPVNFAWIQEIGHYILDSATLMIGDAVIDKFTGEFLHILCFTEGSKDKEKGYFRMIGNVPELCTYNNVKKRKYRLYIPMMFTFSKFYGSALPLMCMQYVDVAVRVKLRDFSDVAYWAPLTKFNKKPKLNCSMIADYIYLDHEERFRMANLKHEMLTELIRYNGDVTVDLSISNTVSVRLNFNGTSKELYIVCQMDGNVDGTLPNGEKQWNNYMVKVPKNETMQDGSVVIKYLDVEPIDTLEIQYNGREREPAKPAMYYSCLEKLKHHTVSRSDGIYVYSFAISPQLLQPSGNANLGKIGYVDLIIKFRDDVVALIGQNKKTMRIGVYNKEVNHLRIMSGLAGLAFYN